MSQAPSAAKHRAARRNERGYTLIEILVAIVLVGILSAVVVLAISNLTDKGSSSGCSVSIDAAKAGSIVYFTTNGTYPATLLEMTSASPPSLTLSPGVTLNGSPVGSNAVGTIATGKGWSMTLIPSAAGRAPTFACGSATGSAAGTAACPGTFTGWVGEYYPNTSLTGTPALCRDDTTAAISFDWGSNGPTPATTDNFSVRWTRTVSFTAGTHAFTIGSDDGSRIYIDGTLEPLSFWSDKSYAQTTFTKALTAGTHTIVFEFYEHLGLARATLTWT